jgi:diadenosine tetraphosphate (Ap4A) HIT family hydrolase
MNLFEAPIGRVALPNAGEVMNDRASGGHLVVYPARVVWDRTAFTRDELGDWSWLIACAARAMLEALPQLRGGCINYWDAGNFAMNDAAPPAGFKDAPAHRRLHQHLLGRSPQGTDADWPWGDAPVFPTYANRVAYCENRQPLDAGECAAISAHLRRAFGR